jgi:peptide/nickel transport system substrate-binding protein
LFLFLRSFPQSDQDSVEQGIDLSCEDLAMVTVLNRSVRRFWVFLLLSVWAAVSLTACNPQNFKTQAAQVTQLIARTPSGPKTFNYAMNDSSPNIFSFTVDAMIGTNAKGDLEPGLIESWKVSDDKLRVTLKLREGMKWSDGQPITIDDVMFTFQEVLLNPKIPTTARSIFEIGDKREVPMLRKVSDREVEFTLPEPFSPILRAFSQSTLLPAHALRKYVNELDEKGNPKFVSTWRIDSDPTQVVSNGPYRITSFIPSQRVIFERNPYYWRKDDQGNIQRIVWQIVENSDTALVQFRSGGLDVLNIGPASFQLLKRGDRRGNYTIYNGGPDAGTGFIAFNLNKGKRNGKPLIDPSKSRWFNTKEFRQAIAYGIDRTKMINNIFRGLAEPQDSLVAVQSPYYLSRKEGLKYYDYNPEKARELLKSAGFKYNDRSELLDSDNKRVRFTLNGPAGGRTGEQILSQIKQDLAKIGIQVDTQQIDFGTIVEKTSNTLDFECIYLGFGNDVEPNSVANLWQPDGTSHLFNQKPQPGQAPVEGRVIADWEAEIGQLFTQAAREYDDAKRKQLYAKVQQIAQEQVPMIHLVNSLGLSAIKNNIQGIDLSMLNYEYALWNVGRLKIVGD